MKTIGSNRKLKNSAASFRKTAFQVRLLAVSALAKAFGFIRLLVRL